MNNVTVENKVVLEQSINDHNKAGYEVVVYKKGAFFKLLSRGENFKKGFFEKDEDFTFYAVASQELLHTYKFKSSFHYGHHIYDIEFVMEYRIVDYKKITLQISLDPLRKVKERAELIVSSGLKKIEWNELIERHYRDSNKLVNDILYNMLQETTNNKMVEGFEAINTTALVYGIEIESLTFRLVFSEEDLRYRITKDKMTMEDEIKDIQLSMERKDIVRQDEMLDLKGTIKVKEVVQDVKIQGIEALSQGFQNILANTTHDATIRNLPEIINQSKAALSSWNSLVNNSQIENSKQNSLLTEAQQNPYNNLPIAGLVNLIKNSSNDLGIRRQITSYLFELLAYSLRGENSEMIIELQEKLYHFNVDENLENAIAAPSLNKIVNEIENILR